MEIMYSIHYLEPVIRSHIPALSTYAKSLIKRAIEERLTLDPIRFGKPLRYSFKGHRRLRVGDYRVIYRVDSDTHIVTIVAIKHRKDIYETYN
jgi:mRNA interferase RelE/StbE